MAKIRFTISEEEREIIRHEGASRGMTAAQFCRMATFAYINKSPSKGVFAILDRSGRVGSCTPRNVASQGDSKGDI